MEPKTVLIKLQPLLKAPSFTSQQAKTFGVSSADLAHYIKTGDLIRIGRGVYKGVDSPAISDFRWEDLNVAIKRIKNGAICLTSALALYDLTDETPRQHWIAIPNNTRHRTDDTVKIIRLRNFKLGKTFIKIDNQKLPIFDRERTIIDSFRYLGIETALKALRNALTKKGKEKIELEKIIKCTKILHVNKEAYLLAVIT